MADCLRAVGMARYSLFRPLLKQYRYCGGRLWRVTANVCNPLYMQIFSPKMKRLAHDMRSVPIHRHWAVRWQQLAPLPQSLVTERLWMRLSRTMVQINSAVGWMVDDAEEE